MHLLIPYVQLAEHADPFFNEFTYGDVRQRARRLKKLKKGTYVFFHTSRHGKKYITAYYVVDRAIDTATAANSKLISDKYKNPHIHEYLAGERKYADDVVLFGDPILSRVFEKPLLFDRKLASKLSLEIKFSANKSETQIIGSATRQWRNLTEKDAKLLFDEIKAQENKECDYTLRSSEEVAETLERDIERLITQNPNLIRKGLKLLGSQRRTDDGRLDVLFEDQAGNLVVVEVKLGHIGRDAIQQIKNYVRYLRKQQNKKVSGIIVCAGVMPAYEEDLRKQKDVRIFVHGWNLQIQEW
jgi:Holliday junction resolvase-like predicted endonuclease